MGLGDVSFCLKGGFLRSVMNYSMYNGFAGEVARF